MGVNADYRDLLETNYLIRKLGDVSHWQCSTRTTQESKLFPVSPYMLLSYLNAFYRYPSLVRKLDTTMSAEQLGDRAREMSSKLNVAGVGWCLPDFYLLGRELLINLGVIGPEDAVDDLVDVLSFWRRFMLSLRRNDGYLTNAEFGHRSQFLPERTLQVFQADAVGAPPGSRLHESAVQFMATVAQYAFLSHTECRLGIQNAGPYPFGAGHEMLVRDYLDLGESDLPWSDDVAADLPYNNLTLTLVLADTHINVVDDWGSFEAQPSQDNNSMVAVGLYTSDYLSDGFLPVAMDSANSLADALDEVTHAARRTTSKLWKDIAGWKRDQMIDAGALIYYAVAKDLGHIAGVYDPADWWTVDPRAERFRGCVTTTV